jgi:CelD/BcsL family acetyltransferase involved in cellulose biosynthesis
MAIDVTCGRRRAAHIIVHDPAFKHLSPGTLLLQEWIKGASADGIATFDLLAPAYTSKVDWADGSIAVNDYAQGLTLAGRAYTVVYLSLLRSALKAGLEAFTRKLGRLRAWRSPAAAAAPQERQPASADTQLPLQRG